MPRCEDAKRHSLYKTAGQLGSKAENRNCHCEAKSLKGIIEIFEYPLSQSHSIKREFVKLFSLLTKPKLFPLAPEGRESSRLNAVNYGYERGVQRHKNTDRATECAMTDIGAKHQNNLTRNDLSALVPQYPSNFYHKKAAFTLAEVLITLGIIGVVAAITMPVLLSNVQDRVKQKRVENIKQKLSKVTDKMAVQSGLIGYGDTMSFVQEMSKHMKLAKICDNNHISDCWPTEEVTLNDEGKTWEISKTKNAKTLKIDKDKQSIWADTVGIVTADGVPMILSYKKDCDFDIDKSGLLFDENSAMSNSMGCLSGVFDWNGGKNPNKLAKITGDTKGDILPFGDAQGLGTECTIQLGNKCFTAPKPAKEYLTYAECNSRKGELKINSCYYYYDKDYWAGAAATCNGTDKMITMAELGQLASLLYKGNPTVGAKQNKYNLTLDTSVATAMGFSGTSFSVWSGEENDSSHADIRNFGSSGTGWNHYVTRDNSYLQVVCSGD